MKNKSKILNLKMSNWEKQDMKIEFLQQNSPFINKGMFVISLTIYRQMALYARWR